MEKKTLGKFIAALRKERGMTQKELGEKLFVTDKTVSRWECDESAPELSLLPVIAELFGVTTDELLRGERKTSEREEAKETSPKQSEERGEKYFRQLLRRQKKRFIEFSLLSVGLTATGVIVAAICNFCFYRASLGFCLACVFFVAAAICQLIFTLNGRLPLEDAESATRRAEIQRINSEIALCSVRVFYGIFCALSACVPLATLPSSYYGLPFGSCLLAAVLFCAVGFFVAFVVYRLFVEELLVKKQVIFLGAEENALREKRRKLLKRVVCVFCSVCLFLFAGAAVVSVPEQKKIEQYAVNHKKDKLFGVVLCLYTGLRIGELLALTWQDIDFGKGLLFVSKTCYDSSDGQNHIRIIDSPKTIHSHIAKHPPRCL